MAARKKHAGRPRQPRVIPLPVVRRGGAGVLDVAELVQRNREAEHLNRPIKKRPHRDRGDR